MTQKMDKRRVAAICELFSSEHESEHATAARLANNLVREAGLRWCDLLTVPTTQSKHSIRHQQSHTRCHVPARKEGDKSVSKNRTDHMMIERLLMRALTLKPEDCEFVASCSKELYLTQSQRKALSGLYDVQFHS